MAKKEMKKEMDSAEESKDEEKKEYDEDGMEKKYKKSEDLTEDDLQKSLDRLSTYAQSDERSRKEVLLEKAKADELSKAENEELFALLGGNTEKADETLSDEIQKSFSENEVVQDALDVSSYLQEQHNELCKSLTRISDHVEQSDSRQHDFNIVLAKAVADVGKLVKSLAQEINEMASQPARGPKSKGVQVLHKSFVGSEPAEETLTKSQVLDTMDQLMADSMAKGREGRALCGEDLSLATAKFESTGAISPQMKAEVESYRRASR